MLTGTPLDLTPFGALLTGIGWLYWLLAAAGLWWALRGSRPWKSNLLRALPVLLMVGFLPLRTGWHSYQARSKLNESMGLFEERCRTAGEKINRTVENVDGVVWMKWRESNDKSYELYADQFGLFDPYGRDCSLEECIGNLLRVSRGASLYPEQAELHANGYRFVETIDPKDGLRYRYVAVVKSIATRTTDEVEQYKKNSGGRDPGPDVYGFALERTRISAFEARYGVIWEDISARVDREHWIAGGSLKLIDLQTDEIVASRVGYLIDTGQGSTAGFRSPWGWAVSYAPRCPAIDVRPREFVARVIQPTKQRE